MRLGILELLKLRKKRLDTPSPKVIKDKSKYTRKKKHTKKDGDE